MKLAALPSCDDSCGSRARLGVLPPRPFPNPHASHEEALLQAYGVAGLQCTIDSLYGKKSRLVDRWYKA